MCLIGLFLLTVLTVSLTLLASKTTGVLGFLLTDNVDKQNEIGKQNFSTKLKLVNTDI